MSIFNIFKRKPKSVLRELVVELDADAMREEVLKQMAGRQSMIINFDAGENGAFSIMQTYMLPDGTASTMTTQYHSIDDIDGWAIEIIAARDINFVAPKDSEVQS